MILTRYLYDKEQVEHSFVIALLNRDRERAKYWIYELYHSGFKQESFILVWRLYYQLYAGFYVNLENLLKQQTLEWLDNNTRHWTIGTIVENMVRREPCIEFYPISRGDKSAPSGLHKWVDRIIAVESNKDEYFKIFGEFVTKNDCFKVKGKKVPDAFHDTFDKIKFLPLELLKYACIARMFTGVFLLDPNNMFDGKVYVILQKKDVDVYNNKPFVQNRSWRILRRECLHTVDLSPNYCSLPYDISNWLERAYKSPIWRQRIEKYGGSLTTDGVVVFDNEDNEEQFYIWYNVEPDEQPIGVIEKWRGIKSHSTWNEIYTYFVNDTATT